MRYTLDEVQADVIKVVLEKVGPITMLDLIKKLKEQKICIDLDNIMFVCEVEKLLKKGLLDRSLIKKSTLLSGLSIAQRQALKEILEEAQQKGESLSFIDMANRCCEKTNIDNPTDVARKIRFLLIPLASESLDDDDECDG
jgi:hypothetical protein